MSGYIKLRYLDTDRNDLTLEVVGTSAVPTLEVLQEAVEGYIEPMFTVQSPVERKGLSITGYVNEEGLCIGLPIVAAVKDEHGVRPFAGQMVIAGLDERTGDTRVLTPREIEWVQRAFRKPGTSTILFLD